MASSSKSNSIREILNRGILISLCLSLLVGSSVLVFWQWGAQVKANDYNASLVHEALRRDSADLLTSAMLKNYDAVAFQLKTALTSLPLQCAYIDLPGQRYTLIGEQPSCASLLKTGDGAHQEEITSGGMTIGPLVYILKSQALPPGSVLYLICAFVGLVGSVILTWSVLIKMINGAILRPLRSLTQSLSTGEYTPNPNITCDEVISLSDQLQQFRTQFASSAKREAFERVARMVAHNIATPVLVLDGVDTSGLDDKSRAIYRSALSDIKGLINNLREEAGASQHLETQSTSENEAHHPSTETSAPTTAAAAFSIEHIMGLVELAVSEKRLENRSPVEIVFEPTASSYAAFAKIQRTELKCALLNLMNNAVEALSGRDDARVAIGVEASEDLVRISVRDNGPGVAQELLNRLGERGFSVGKNGSGLGLHHAKAMATAAGGSVTIESTPGEGFCVTIELPLANPPEWFASEISVPLNGGVTAIDDDPSVAMAWRKRFRDANVSSIDDILTTFEHGGAFKAWVYARSSEDKETLFLVDYELNGQDQNGISLVEELGIAEDSILVTGRYDDPTVQAKVRWLGMRMIPKPLMGLVPIRAMIPES